MNENTLVRAVLMMVGAAVVQAAVVACGSAEGTAQANLGSSEPMVVMATCADGYAVAKFPGKLVADLRTVVATGIRTTPLPGGWSEDALTSVQHADGQARAECATYFSSVVFTLP